MGLVDYPIVTYIIPKNVRTAAEICLNSFKLHLWPQFLVHVLEMRVLSSCLFFSLHTEHKWKSSKYLIDRFELLYGEIRRGCRLLPKVS